MFLPWSISNQCLLDHSYFIRRLVIQFMFSSLSTKVNKVQGISILLMEIRISTYTLPDVLTMNYISNQCLMDHGSIIRRLVIIQFMFSTLNIKVNKVQGISILDILEILISTYILPWSMCNQCLYDHGYFIRRLVVIQFMFSTLSI